jgi:hypothetical protein
MAKIQRAILSLAGKSGAAEFAGGLAGKPAAKPVPYEQVQRPSRTPGLWGGKVRIAGDFEELPPGLASAFRGEQP